MDGASYQFEFEEAVSELCLTNDPDEVRLKLLGLEWMFWENFKHVLGMSSVFFWILISLPFVWLIRGEFETLTIVLVWFPTVLVASILLYWFVRLVFWHEITRHVSPGKFGRRELD